MWCPNYCPTQLPFHLPPGFHIDPYHGEDAANVMADFFERSLKVGSRGAAPLSGLLESLEHLLRSMLG